MRVTGTLQQMSQRGKVSRWKRNRKSVPFFIKANNLQTENDRPISFLSSISKTFKSNICKRMTKSFSQCDFLSKNQYDFRKNRSCINAIVEVKDYLREQLDKKYERHFCFLDIQKAFDTSNTMFFYLTQKDMVLEGKYLHLFNIT